MEGWEGCRYVQRDTLFSGHAAAEAMLQALMSLYVASHYRNTPDDLLMLADAPAHHLFALLGPVDESQVRPAVMSTSHVVIWRYPAEISLKAPRVIGTCRKMVFVNWHGIGSWIGEYLAALRGKGRPVGAKCPGDIVRISVFLLHC